MLDSILNESVATITTQAEIICILVAIVLGLVISFIHSKTNSKYSKNFLVTLAILPLLVHLVIMMVNGNLGTSVAILGAFSLVRFRSVPGNSKELISIFFAMVVGLILGVGYVLLAVIVTIVIGTLLIVLGKSKFGEKNNNEMKLKITIPENINQDNLFDDIFIIYTKSNRLESVKTTNMGSMYELTYSVILKENKSKKEFIDEIRCRNGNLNISLMLCPNLENEL